MLFVGEASLEMRSILWRACGLFEEDCQPGGLAGGGRDERVGCTCKRAAEDELFGGCKLVGGGGLGDSEDVRVDVG